jgi:hypothetical protein
VGRRSPRRSAGNIDAKGEYSISAAQKKICAGQKKICAGQKKISAGQILFCALLFENFPRSV